MLIGHLALTVAALFTGAAFYINFAEQPARLALDNRAMLAQWKPSYARGFTMQASLAVIGFLLGAATWFVTNDWRWLAGAIVLVANWPFTMFVIMPVNYRLNKTPPESAGPVTRSLVEKWAKLHAVRTGFGAIATLTFIWALN